MTNEPLLEARGLTKAFGSLLANDSVDLLVQPGEIHALLGENGAGKSTLVKMLYGSLSPTEGQIFWKGQAVNLSDPSEARKLGIGMVFQHFSLFDSLTVVENIALAMPKGQKMSDLAKRIETVSRNYGLPLTATNLVADLSVGERQRIEIVRCLLQEPELIIMDEPTSVLTPQETELLFETLERLASEGKSILYISHRLEEVQRICDTATILRHGKLVAHCTPSEETASSLATLMVGTNVQAVERIKPDLSRAPVRLRLDRLDLVPAGPFSVELKDISLEVRGGEVVAIAGIAGNGQSELFDALSGEREVLPDAVVINDEPVGTKSVTARRNLGAAFVPEERLGHAAVPGLSLSENVLLTRHGSDKGLTRRGVFLKRTQAGEIGKRISSNFDVRKGEPDPQAGSLSGGNLQKFVVGREIDRNPSVLVVSQPTWGVDAGAAALIRQSLLDLAREGAAVLIISQDLDEIFEIADRIAVINQGTMSPADPAEIMTLEKVGLLMGGVHGEDPHKTASASIPSTDGANSGGAHAS
ncbi:nucleoside ABC transporter ATP-binding protein [Cohaesibacter sp. ES.047]|uniref:ABC transporter ATP-binding protein n=1 Tax=Cohaesibacter sp. ES.047 TaxID=1798205 RepID=UPI000BB815DB|nr:ABC transporter ATP-binding protein [Cohaesibacter sp. ES.047]SNY93339.1 nucleoside ABC transporter ATP-binding protein [Cohaesibacter sp. ES.047]